MKVGEDALTVESADAFGRAYAFERPQLASDLDRLLDDKRRALRDLKDRDLEETQKRLEKASRNGGPPGKRAAAVLPVPLFHRVDCRSAPPPRHLLLQARLVDEVEAKERAVRLQRHAQELRQSWDAQKKAREGVRSSLSNKEDAW